MIQDRKAHLTGKQLYTRKYELDHDLDMNKTAPFVACVLYTVSVLLNLRK